MPATQGGRMKLPDRETSVVLSENGETTRFGWFSRIQPDLEGVVDGATALALRGRGTARARRFVLEDGVWRDDGPAPSPVDASWHPDLGNHLGSGIAVARDVLARINRGRVVSIWPTCVSRSDSGWSIASSAMFSTHAPGRPTEQSGIASEDELDAIPQVRFVERMAVEYAELFGVEPHDDGSGVEGDMVIEVRTDGLTISFRDDDGVGVTLSSELEGGIWRHATILEFPVDPDPVARLRQEADPRAALRDMIASLDPDDDEAVDVACDPLGLGPADPARNVWRDILSEDVVVESASSEDTLMLRIRPGTLFTSNS